MYPVEYLADSLDRAHAFLRDFKLPSDGERTICLDQYSGELPEEVIQDIVQKTTYLSWNQIRTKARETILEFLDFKKDYGWADFYFHLPARVISSELIMLAETWDLWRDIPSLKGFIIGIPKGIPPPNGYFYSR